MTTFMESDGQTNIDKYREVAHKLLQNIILEQNFDLLHHLKDVKK